MDLPARFGKYELIEHLATGGMAEVFLARSFGAEGFEKRLVIKRILPGLARNPRFVSMFVKEAKITAGLAHPNIVQIYELGRVGADPYIAMEYIDGVDLTRLMRSLRREGRSLPIALAIYLGACLVRGLGHAHAATDGLGRPLNLVHRDVSPHNVLVSFQGEVKLFDFGIARLVGEAGPEDPRGRPGGGKYAYMSPEQARGEPLDRRSDLYSAGVVLYELLVGHRLHQESDPALKLQRVQAGQVADPRAERPEIPDRLAAALMRLLAPQPADRHPSADEAEEELWAALFATGERADAARMAAFVREVAGEGASRRRGVVDLHGLSADLRRLQSDRSDATPTDEGAAAAPAPEESPAPGLSEGLRPGVGERKRVALLVAEVVGLTDLSARADPERVVRGHIKFLRRARRAVGRYGGLIESWHDDTLVVFFGVPRADELDLERCVACAQELVDLARAMERHGLAMGLCVGVHRGDLTLSPGGARNLRYLAMGDTVKMARRLCYEAEVGEVLVSQEVGRLTSDCYRYSPGPRIRVKGERRHAQALLLEGRRRLREGPSGRWMPRGDEIGVLRRALARVAEGGSARVHIAGPAGCGKTRLVRELRALARLRGVPSFTARAIPYGSDGPAAIFKDLVSDVLALEGREPADVLSDRLERLSQLGLSEAERGLVRALFALHPAERGQRQEAASLLKVASALLQGLASTQPIIVALEDAQHLRDHEIVLIGAAMEATAQAPILWIITSRGPAPPGLGQAHAGILVGPLTDAQQHDLVCELLPEALGEARAVGPALSALLARTTQGNPLYVEAVVDALLRAERLTLRQGVAVLADPDREVRLPPGLEPLLAARVDALPAPLKDALQVAAIIGINLSPALLAASLGLDSAQPLLEELDRRGLVHLPADGAEGRCTFASALVWEAVLHSILDLRRRDLHRRVAEGLGRLHAGNLDGAREALARHHAGAGAFLDAATHIDRAGDLLRAQQLMREAGTCWDRAVGWLGAARRSGSRPAPPIDLEAVIRIKAGAAWAVAGEPQRAELHLQVALELAEEGASPEIEPRAQLELGRLYRAQGRPELARIHLELALQGAMEALDSNGPPPWSAPVAVGALEGLGLVWHERGASAEAEAAFEAAVQQAGEDPALRARALSGLALPSVRAGDEARALSLLHAALAAAERAGDRLLIGRIVNNIGIVHHGAGRYTDALACFHRSRALRQGLGYRNGVAINLHNVGDTHLRMGDRARAFAAFHKSRDLCVAARWERGEVLNDTFLAWLDLDVNPDRDAWQAAYARLLEAGRRARDLADLETALTGAWLQGRALVGQGAVAQAAVVLEAALGEAEELDAASLVRDLRASLAGCAAPG